MAPSAYQHPRVPALFSLAFAGMILGASSVPGMRLHHVPVSFTTIHFIVYFIFGCLLMWWRMSAPRSTRAGALVQASFMGSIYGLLDETYQSIIPGRTSDPVDWVVDVAGIVVGSSLAALISMGARRP
ncbi:MAG: VanZ family protein [Deltaproteobacteria bacterium]